MRAIRLLPIPIVMLTACASGMSQTQPGMTRVTVGVTTTGPQAERLMFRVDIDPEGISGSIKSHAGIFSSGNLPPGEHVVRLAGLPERCAVRGPAEQRITSSTERPVLVRYEVVCR